MIERIREAVLRGDAEAAAEATNEALEKGIQLEAILDQGLIAPMDVVGEEYESGIRYIPEMLVSAEAMRRAMLLLRPHLAKAGVRSRGTVIIGTVEGDLHDIGKDLVAMMLEGAGFEVVNLGVEVPAKDFVNAVRDHRPDVVAISALLTTTMIYMPAVLEALETEGLRSTVKVIVGGAPVTQAYADEIGADGYAADAAGAVAVVRKLVAAT